jgi:50S ribosomal subunit-associated GTPase HflX
LGGWVSTFTEIAGSQAIVVVVGNKSDLVDEIVVKEADVKAWTEERHFKYMFTSAKDGTGISELFALTAHELGNREKAVNEGIVPPEIPVRRESTPDGCC